MASSHKGRSKLIRWIGLVIIILLLIGAFSDSIVKWLWLSNIGYAQVFWTIKITQALLFVGALIIALLYVLPNMYVLSKHIPHFDLNLGQTPLGQMNVKHFNARQIKIFLYSAGSLVSVFFSFIFFSQWDTYFRFNWHQTVGKLDPIFHHDIGFYLFRLPFIQIIQNSFIVLVFFVTFAMIVMYLANGAISIQKSDHAPSIQIRKSARRHLAINVGLWLLLLAWGYYLQRYDLLYGNSGLVFGAGYTDIHVVLPVLWVMTIGCLLLACLAFYQYLSQKTSWLLKGGLGLLAIGIIGQVLLPPLIENFEVQPNELQLETPYLKNNITQTRQAYKLNTFKERKYSAADTLSFSKVERNGPTLNNIRLWDPRLIIQTYRQLQEIRLYYQFFHVGVDRYHTNEGYKQMMVSARELSSELPPKAQTWVNKHLQYTHGYGLVMSPVAEIGKEGDPRLVIKDLPPASSINLPVNQAAIYYGQHKGTYKLVHTNVKELDYPKGDQNVYTNYNGKGGVGIDNFFKKLLFAWEFSDFNLLLTDYIHRGSKIQFWRDVKTRVKKIAPFLRLEDKPYLVLSQGKLYWMQDAYTTSKDYPYSKPYKGQYNYIRNSVKVVVDAYDGTVNFYVADAEDPILDVYRDVFPGMFKPLDTMPATLKQHVRYPVDLFEAQVELYNTYHMTDPQVFYNNEDLWTRPNEKYGGRQVKMEPYYMLSKLPGEDKLQYLLITPLTPSNRDNMIAWVSAKSDVPDYGDVEVFSLPKEKLFLGPAQIEAKIDQSTEISRQLSLWDQRGSKVIRGNLMVIPIEDSFLYVEPVFLIAEGVDIPQLQRVIATTGTKTIMEPTMDEAIEALFGKKPQHPITKELPSQKQQLVTPTPQFERFKTLWHQMQTALQNGDWQQFGEKMKQIDELLNNK